MTDDSTTVKWPVIGVTARKINQRLKTKIIKYKINDELTVKNDVGSNIIPIYYFAFISFSVFPLSASIYSFITPFSLFYSL